MLLPLQAGNGKAVMTAVGIMFPLDFARLVQIAGREDLFNAFGFFLVGRSQGAAECNGIIVVRTGGNAVELDFKVLFYDINLKPELTEFVGNAGKPGCRQHQLIALTGSQGRFRLEDQLARIDEDELARNCRFGLEQVDRLAELFVFHYIVNEPYANRAVSGYRAGCVRADIFTPFLIPGTRRFAPVTADQ